MIKRFWTSEEVEFLEKHFSKMKTEDIAQHLGRGYASVWHKAKSLELTTKPDFWTEKEDHFIMENYGKMTSIKIAKKLGRTKSGVRTRAGKLGVTTQQKQWSKEDIDYLNKNYATKSFEEMCNHLGVPKSALRSKVSVLNLTRRQYVSDAFCVDCGKKIYKYEPQPKRCVKCSNNHRSGENHANWQGGISSLIDIVRNHLYEVWTFPIMKRDGFFCRVCGKNGELHVHHIRTMKEITGKVLSENPNLSIEDNEQKHEIARIIIREHNMDEGITMCVKCHRSFHFENGVNCLESPNVKSRVISSQAIEGKGSMEGSTTRKVSPNNNPFQERPAHSCLGV